MEELFNALPGDKGLVITLVREANIALASLPKDTADYLWRKEKYEEAIKVMRSLEDTEPQHDDDINFILNTINTIWEKGILSPLTLKDDEFEIVNEQGFKINTRYPNIYMMPSKDKDGNKCIYNHMGYKATVRNEYDAIINEQRSITIKVYHKCPQIFINKGGRVTGEFINLCRIRPEIVNQHNYTIQSTVNIPVSAIYKGKMNILTVDHREPKLKVLKEFYEVSGGFYEDIDNAKIDIRKFKKI